MTSKSDRLSMKKPAQFSQAFTLMELLVVIGIIAVLAALLLPVLGDAKARAKRTVCLNNLRQVNLGVLMYAHDSSETMPDKPDADPPFCYSYKELMKSYVGLTGRSSTSDRVFVCPSECPTPTYTLPSQEEFCDYSSYPFNTRIQGRKTTSISQPVKTVLVMDFPALFGFSWHKPQSPTFTVSDVLWNRHIAYNDALNPVSFVDGHAACLKIYCDGKSQSWASDPPPGYDYKWNGD